ncbi:MAG: hypothetical protein ACJAYG_002205 [Oceanicoccus sp.]
MLKLLANKTLLNALLFQLGWFACVLGGDYIALPFLLVALYLHSRFFIQQKAEWQFIAAVALVGLLLDNLLAISGVMQFSQAGLPYMPLWLFCLWGLFAITLNHSLVWLKQRLWLAALLGGVSGSLSYFAGSRLTGVILLDPAWQSIIVIGLCWSLILPLLMLLLRRLCP